MIYIMPRCLSSKICVTEGPGTTSIKNCPSLFFRTHTHKWLTGTLSFKWNEKFRSKVILYKHRVPATGEDFTHANRGDQKKLMIGHHKLTAPLPVKNDSSLKVIKKYAGHFLCILAIGLQFNSNNLWIAITCFIVISLHQVTSKVKTELCDNMQPCSYF